MKDTVRKGNITGKKIDIPFAKRGPKVIKKAKKSKKAKSKK